MSFKITWKTNVICFGISIIITLILWSIANGIIQNFILQDFMEYPTRLIVANFYIAIILLLIPIIAVHEAVHGITYIMFGGKVKYGFKGIYVYTQEVSELPIERTKFLIILLAPLTIMSIPTLLLPNWLGGMIFLLNLLESSGDLFMSFKLIGYDWNSKIIDRKYGFDVV